MRRTPENRIPAGARQNREHDKKGIVHRNRERDAGFYQIPGRGQFSAVVSVIY